MLKLACNKPAGRTHTIAGAPCAAGLNSTFSRGSVSPSLSIFKISLVLPSGCALIILCVFFLFSMLVSYFLFLSICLFLSLSSDFHVYLTSLLLCSLSLSLWLFHSVTSTLLICIEFGIKGTALCKLYCDVLQKCELTQKLSTVGEWIFNLTTASRAVS